MYSEYSITHNRKYKLTNEGIRPEREDAIIVEINSYKGPNVSNESNFQVVFSSGHTNRYNNFLTMHDRRGTYKFMKVCCACQLLL